MKKIIKMLSAGILVLSLSACSLQNKVDKEIQLPIYETEKKINTVEVKKMNLEESIKTAASLGYATSDSLSAPVRGNLKTLDAVPYQQYKEGDLLASFDSSELDYEYRMQSILTEAAEETYRNQGTETARLEYEYQKSLLEEIEYRIDQYNIYAPYDCIITGTAHPELGAQMEAGDYICSVAPESDVFLYVAYEEEKEGNNSPYKLGAKIGVTITGKDYEATVVGLPESCSYDHPLKYMSNSPDPRAYSKENLGLWEGDYKTEGLAFGNPNSGSPSADSDRNVIIKFKAEDLTRLLEESPSDIRAGWATITVTTKKYSNVLALPQNAVTTRDASYVYLYENDQRLQTPVTIGDTVNGYTIILAGLCEGDLVTY